MSLEKAKKEPMSLLLSKFSLGLSFVVSLLAISIVSVFVFTRDIDLNEDVGVPEVVKSIAVSSDGKSIIDPEVGKVIFAIEGAQSYLETSGYAYDPDTFQNTNAKYAGDCFSDASLSNNKDIIVFSTGCLAGDLPQAWIGIYKIDYGSFGSSTKCMLDSGASSNINPQDSQCLKPLIKFLIGGSGKNFVWSQDDKTITYEADLGLSGMMEIRKIDAMTGKISEKKPTEGNNLDWKTYKNEEYGFEIKYPDTYAKSDGCYSLFDTFCLDSLKNIENNSTINLRIMDGFEMQKIKIFAPTGNIYDPEQKNIGQNIFYYYGPGGGGVRYPDRYFYNLNDKTLIFEFDGPYNNDKMPSEEAKKIELQILSTFKFKENK